MITCQCLIDGMMWQNIGRLEAGQPEVPILSDFNATPSLMSNLWKQFQDTESIERKPGQGHLRAMMADKDFCLFIIARSNRITTASEPFHDHHAAISN